MTKLFYNVEIKCYPASDFKIADFVLFVNEREERIVTEIVTQLLLKQIKTVDLVSSTTKLTSSDKNCILFSYKGRGIFKPDWHYEDFCFTKYSKKTIEQDLAKELSFLSDDLSITMNLKKMNILAYYITSLKYWFLSKKTNNKKILIS